MIRYRPDIDGLRALAVLPVVLFHAGVPFFSGGFVGVDIFFVISGYLITAILLKDIHQEQFSIIRFYERRLRRIFPALFLVLLLTTLAASLWMIPKDFKDFGIGLTGAVFFFSNIVFWRQSGYFDLPAESKPLLHTWSLAVEEQFYIFFPLFLWALHRFIPMRVRLVLLFAATGSFIYSVWGVQHHPEAAFYLAPYRAWELLLGSLLACGAFPLLRSHLLRQSFGLVGLALILSSVIFISKTTPFPGLAALPPCLGALLIIYSGQRQHELDKKTWAQQWLSTKPLVGVGLISYSLYLWHWPMLVMGQHLALEKLTLVQNMGLIALAVLGAYASWRWIEAPFRSSVPYAQQNSPSAKKALSQRAKRVIPIKPFATISVLLMIALGGFGLFGFLSKGWKTRFPQSIHSILAVGERANRPGKCLSHPAHFIKPKQACTRGAENKPVTIALWGDSHADSWLEPLGNEAKHTQKKLVFYGYSGCPPVSGIRRQGKGAQHACPQYNQAVINELKQRPNIKTVVLLARHSAYLYGRNTDFGTAEVNDTNPIVITDLSHSSLSRSEREGLYAKQLNNTVETLRNINKNVVLVYPIPETGIRIPEWGARTLVTGHQPDKLSRPRNYYDQRQRFMIQTLDEIRPADNGVMRIKPHELLCGETTCRVFNGKTPLYQDDDHLSPEGVMYLKPLWQNILTEPKA